MREKRTRRCYSQTRSAPAPRGRCALGQRSPSSRITWRRRWICSCRATCLRPRLAYWMSFCRLSTCQSVFRTPLVPALPILICRGLRAKGARVSGEGIRRHAHIGQGSLVATRPILPVGAQIAAAPPRGNCQALSALRSIHGRARPDRCGDSSALLHQHFSDHHARSRRYTSGGREEGIFRTARNLNVHTPGQASAAIVHKLIKIKVGVDSRGQS